MSEKLEYDKLLERVEKLENLVMEYELEKLHGKYQFEKQLDEMAREYELSKL